MCKSTCTVMTRNDYRVLELIYIIMRNKNIGLYTTYHSYGFKSQLCCHQLSEVVISMKKKTKWKTVILCIKMYVISIIVHYWDYLFQFFYILFKLQENFSFCVLYLFLSNKLWNERVPHKSLLYERMWARRLQLKW